MDKIDTDRFYTVPDSAERAPRAPHGAGVMLAIVTGTLCWAGLFLLFI